MPHSRFTTLSLLAVLLLGIPACKGKSLEGKYSLDKAAMKKDLEAKLAAKSGPEKDMGQLAVAMVDMMEMSIELKPAGVAQVTVSMTDPQAQGTPPKSESKAAKWTQKDKTVTIQVEGDTSQLTCTAEGKRLDCSDGKEAKLSFVRP